jgi:hypothetical protein
MEEAMHSNNLRSSVLASFGAVLLLAGILTGCAPLAQEAHAEDLTTQSFCGQIEKLAARPHLIMLIDETGEVLAASGGKPADFPPTYDDGSTPDITEIVSLPITIFEGSTWFCYKVAGKKKCVQY